MNQNTFVKFDSESECRAAARQRGEQPVSIVESRNEFFLEEGDSPMVRTWERLVYTGKGQDA